MVSWWLALTRLVPSISVIFHTIFHFYRLRFCVFHTSCFPTTLLVVVNRLCADFLSRTYLPSLIVFVGKKFLLFIVIKVSALAV